jgi:hypothetical protein
MSTKVDNYWGLGSESYLKTSLHCIAIGGFFLQNWPKKNYKQYLVNLVASLCQWSHVPIPLLDAAQTTLIQLGGLSMKAVLNFWRARTLHLVVALMGPLWQRVKALTGVLLPIVTKLCKLVLVPQSSSRSTMGHFFIFFYFLLLQASSLATFEYKVLHSSGIKNFLKEL